MTETLSVLGQAVGTGADAVLYAVAGGEQAVVSTIIFCNQSASPVVFRLAVVPNGQVLGSKHYIAYDLAIQANEVYPFTIGVSMGASDSIHFTAPATVSVSAFGARVS